MAQNLFKTFFNGELEQMTPVICLISNQKYCFIRIQFHLMKYEHALKASSLASIQFLVEIFINKTSFVKNFLYGARRK